jgi:hypothetical protein
VIVQAINAIGSPDRAGAESGPPLAASNMTNIVNGGTGADIFYDHAVFSD